jgi:hypothetical protein
VSEAALPSQGLQLLAELERTGAITPTSLTLKPGVSFDRMEALITLFGQVHRQSAWILGDAINYTEAAYGEIYAQAHAWTGLAEQTLMNYASTCGRIPKSRRRGELPFSVHAEIAALDAAEQKEWLEKASKGRWTRSILRLELAPIRAQKELAKSREKREIEVLPPAVEVPHLCHCHRCGRSHRNDVDVTE